MISLSTCMVFCFRLMSPPSPKQSSIVVHTFHHIEGSSVFLKVSFFDSDIKTCSLRTHSSILQPATGYKYFLAACFWINFNLSCSNSSHSNMNVILLHGWKYHSLILYRIVVYKRKLGTLLNNEKFKLDFLVDFICLYPAFNLMMWLLKI